MENRVDILLEKSKKENAKILEGSTCFKDKEDKHFHWVRVMLIWSLSLILLIMGGVMAWHLIGPSEYRWLTKQETAELKNMAVTGILGVVLGRFGNKLMV